MGNFDKRRAVEIDVGAALNDAEAVESLIDDLLIENTADGISATALRKTANARHHAFQARLIIARVFESITKNEFSPDYALGEMRSARDHAKAIFDRVINVLPGRQDRSEHQDNILDRLDRFTQRIQTAIRSIEVRQLEAS
jgi:methylaspartate ammonia-lyase